MDILDDSKDDIVNTYNESKSLSVLSYNIFFGKLYTDDQKDILDRLDNLCIEIIELNATVVCLQEVTPDRYKIIISNLEKIYPYRYPDKITQSYDTAILSKYQIVKKTKINYSVTKMARSIMCIVIKSPYEPNKEIVIATSHLESEFGYKLSDMNTKLLQYSEAADILNQVCDSCNIKDVIFCADFNSHNKLCDMILYKNFKYITYVNYEQNINQKNINWKDAWIERGMDEKYKLSFDSESNPIMLKMHSNKKNKPYYASRLDRILHRSDLFVHEFQVKRSDQLLSDHYPIFALFKKYPTSDKIEYISYNDSIKARSTYRNSLSSKLKRISLFKN